MAAHTSAVAEPQDRVLTMTRSFDAPPALLFKLWTQPEHIVRWWGPRGYRLSHCSMDVRPGGAWRMCMRSTEGKEHWIHGVYQEIVPPERLVFTYINDADGHEMLVTLNFAARDARTEMSFRQAVFLNVAERDGHNFGWSSTMELLAEYVAQLPAGEG
jgi:uncharacterized protein YndB with AHSA1/START domain